MTVLLEEVMRHPRIASLVEELVQLEVQALVAKKEQLRTSIEKLERQHGELLEKRRQAEKEQRAIAPAVAKAIRTAFDKARGDALETLGQVAVFKALIDELVEPPTVSAFSMPSVPERFASIGSAVTVRAADGCSAPLVEMLGSLGVTPKWARAIELVGTLAHECRLILIIDGLVARLAAESWLSGGVGPANVLECGIGISDDSVVRAVLAESPDAIAILDANFSPLDVYARPIIDVVQRRLSFSFVR